MSSKTFLHPRILLTACLCLLAAAADIVASPGQAQESADAPAARKGWRKQEPLPTSWDLHDVVMISSLEGWAVSAPFIGEAGEVLHTVNGGKTWTVQDTITSELRGVSFADGQHGVAVGNTYRYTTDGGVTWQAGSANSFGTMEDVELVDATVGYAAATGLVMKTTDGGQNWVKQTVPNSSTLAGIDFVNATTGWAVGSGNVFKTSDGGNSWIRQRQDSSEFYTGVSFINELEKWECSNGTILHTTDGGTSWVAQSFPAGADPVAIRFFDSQNGFVAGGIRTILRTTNGGQTWTLQLGGNFNDPNNRYPLNGLDATGANAAVAVGGGNSIYVTTNGSKWVSRGSGSATIPFRMVRTDANHIWSANNNSEVLYTTNGGRNWSRSIIQLQLDCDTCSNTADLAFLDNKEGWAVINGLFTSTSFVWHTVDGGKTWQSLNTLQTGPLSGVAAVDAQTVVAVSSANLDQIWRSTDGGQSWNLVPHQIVGGFFGAVRFIPGTQTGYAVGSGEKIFKSADGGASWTLQRHNINGSDLIDVSFADVNNGWAVGGILLHTTDGGATWGNKIPASRLRFPFPPSARPSSGSAAFKMSGGRPLPVRPGRSKNLTTRSGLPLPLWTAITPGSADRTNRPRLCPGVFGSAVGEVRAHHCRPR